MIEIVCLFLAAIAARVESEVIEPGQGAGKSRQDLVAALCRAASALESVSYSDPSIESALREVREALGA